jgi:hypothetical protein
MNVKKVGVVKVYLTTKVASLAAVSSVMLRDAAVGPQWRENSNCLYAQLRTGEKQQK